MKRLLIVAALAASASVAPGSVASAQAVTVTLAEFTLALSRDTVKAGPVTFRVKNGGKITHGFYVRGEGIAKGSHDIEAGQEGSLMVTLKPGSYELYCPMSDMTHKNAGMSKKLVVIAGDAPPVAKKKPGT